MSPGIKNFRWLAGVSVIPADMLFCAAVCALAAVAAAAAAARPA
jgi:hypothetical protein